MGAPVESVIQVECTDCGKQNKVLARHAGRRGRCGRCRATIRIPTFEGLRVNAERERVERTREDRQSEDEWECQGCGVALMPGLTTCHRCKRAWSGWYGLVAMLIGIPLAIVGGGFAYASAVATGFAVYLIWMVGALGVVSFFAGAIDLTRALLARSTGQPDPRPLAVGWVLKGS